MVPGCARTPQPSAGGPPPAMQMGRDTFAFANETVWNYEAGKVVGRTDRPDTPKDGERYTRRCFVMARAAVQFWKFARFEPGREALPPEELAARVRKIASVPVWEPAPGAERKTVIPGYADLHDLSTREPRILQENMGEGWPTYFRPGNFGIVTPPARAAQERTAGEIDLFLNAGEPPILWLVNFPSLSINHAVVVLRRRVEGPRTVYTVYDPNLPGEGMELAYDPATRTFSYPPTFYFVGGPVDARVVYRGVWR